MPNDENKYNITSKIEYVSNNLITHPIFLLDSNNYLSQTNIIIKSKTKKDLAYELIEYLIIDNRLQDKIPSGFKSFLPENTIINGIDIENDTIKIDFNEALLDTKSELEEKIIEAIVYNLTSIEGVDKVIIFINGDILSYLPKSHKTIPSTLTREFGINKKYDITNKNNINKTTIYYVGMFNDQTYYTPITKVSNNPNDKIEIIVEELCNNNYNLYSYLNNNTKVINSNIENNIMTVDFNEYILNDIDELDVEKEILDTLSLSIYDNYDIDEIVFKVNGQEFSKIKEKSIE